MRALTVLAALVLSSSSAHALGPCFDPVGSLTGLAIPPDGAADVPTNAIPLVDGGDLEVSLLGPGGVPEAVALEDLLVDGGDLGLATVQRVVPARELSPGQTYTIVVDGQPRTTFTVGAGVDLEPPEAPAGNANAIDGCSSVIVGVASEGAAFFIGVVDGQPTFGANVTLNGLSRGLEEFSLFGSASAVVNVAAVDLAGNVSTSVPVEVRQQGFDPSCASTSGDASAIIVLALVGVRARSRAASARRR